MKPKSLRKRKIEIDLTGHQGNAFVLLGYACDLCKLTGKDVKQIQADMVSGDYEHLLQVFEREFGDFVTMYR